MSLPWIQTYTGAAFELSSAPPDKVQILDIAHALSMICRFTGHTREFYSVAEHSVRVSQIVPPEYAFEGLLHDSAEAYIGDISSPLKQVLRGSVLSQLEANLLGKIGLRFQVVLAPMPAAVKHADLVLLATEARDLMERPSKAWLTMPDPLPERIVPWSWREAKDRFLDRFIELKRSY